MSSSSPKLSVIIPGHNTEETLRECLLALSNQNLAREMYEIIYVDDSSSDKSLEVAEPFVNETLKLTGGPVLSGAARNAAARIARGDILVFIDADVVVSRDTLSKLSDALESNSEFVAVFGSYDDSPGASGTVSQYRNLLHHHVHQTGEAEASTFWSGCGAIRKTIFLQLGGFPHGVYLEDIELGKSIRMLGMRIRLDSEIQVKHLKRWSFWGMLYTDLFRRGIPWMRQLLYKPQVHSEIGHLNLKVSGITSVVLSWLSISGLLFSFLHTGFLFFGLFFLLLLFLLNYSTLKFFYYSRGGIFLLKILPLYFLYHFMNGVAVILALGEYFFFILAGRVFHQRRT